jgi:hypothetical protein
MREKLLTVTVKENVLIENTKLHSFLISNGKKYVSKRRRRRKKKKTRVHESLKSYSTISEIYMPRIIS